MDNRWSRLAVQERTVNTGALAQVGAAAGPEPCACASGLAGLSVVIPALDAAATLGGTIGSVRGASEVVVVDGGSVDGTRALAARLGARVVEARRGRGVQLAAGIAAASGEWLLLLHADTRLSAGWAAVCLAHVEGPPGRVGYFALRLDSADRRARRLERLVAWRCRVLALPYGDQGLLVSRAVLDAAGGMPELGLMEDVALLRRLRRSPGRGSVVALDAQALTSAARWERDGWLRRSCRNLACLALWRAGVPVAVVAWLYGRGRGGAASRSAAGAVAGTASGTATGAGSGASCGTR